MKQLFSLAGERAEASAGERVPNPMPEPDESGSALRPNRATRDRTQDKERNLVLVGVWHGCEKAFMSKQAMQLHHSSVHLGVKHVCPVAGCAEEFGRKSSMEQRHRSAHLGVKHVCPAAGCAEEFGRKSSMEHHHRSAHLGVDGSVDRFASNCGDRCAMVLAAVPSCCAFVSIATCAAMSSGSIKCANMPVRTRVNSQPACGQSITMFGFSHPDWSDGLEVSTVTGFARHTSHRVRWVACAAATCRTKGTHESVDVGLPQL